MPNIAYEASYIYYRLLFQHHISIGGYMQMSSYKIDFRILPFS
jgi:hypothetical protein